MSSCTQSSAHLPTFDKAPLIAGSALIGIGALICMGGAALAGAHVFAATRQWLHETDRPPTEMAKAQWAKTRAAAHAGATAWRENAMT
ncbi:hypothetical protein EDD29_3286 [Actinocorallia herbida]|uniref:Uncharacterized protein n=1 Tax=Actinocorallia herbida TaxID=58109 RepID=A0A3N1CWS4_9ACTN|nr:hypothetical protein [Actinocorallia herbida]ROO85737.1 hypothetical protein EDD29_3286 [Actinocorallia herbida]